MEDESKEEPLKVDEEQEGLAESAQQEELEAEEREMEAALEEVPAEETEIEEKEVPVSEEEEVKPAREEKAEEEEIVEERIYTVPLGKAWIMPPAKRTARAVRMLRSFITKHMKLEERHEAEAEEEEEPKRLIISNEVNEKIWARGMEKPTRKIRVRAAKDKEGNVTVYLAEGD